LLDAGGLVSAIGFPGVEGSAAEKLVADVAGSGESDGSGEFEESEVGGSGDRVVPRLDASAGVEGWAMDGVEIGSAGVEGSAGGAFKVEVGSSATKLGGFVLAAD
jgi:hypothetical protein